MGLADEARQHRRQTATPCDVLLFVEVGGMTMDEFEEALTTPGLTQAAIARAMKARAEKIEGAKPPAVNTIQRHKARECKRCYPDDAR